MRESAATASDQLLQIGRLQRELAARLENDQHAEQRHAQREQEMKAREEQLARREIELKARFGTQLLAAQNEINAAVARERDSQAKIRQLEQEYATLIKEAEQLRKDNDDLQLQVDELAASRCASSA